MEVFGILKLFCINLGIIVINLRFVGFLNDECEEELCNMEFDEFWYLEEKYDFFIDDIYGFGCILYCVKLIDFWVFNWVWDSDVLIWVNKVFLMDCVDLLLVIVKCLGLFY